MTDVLADIAYRLTPALLPAPDGMHWEASVWREADPLNYTFHATWRLVPTITFEDDQ